MLCLLFTAGCQRMDNNLFNNSKVDAYYFNNENQEISLDSNYKIAAEKFSLFTLVSDNNGDKADIYALYIGDTTTIATDTVILYLHGTRDNMSYYWNRTKLLAHAGGKYRYGVLTIDYRGYGRSGGTPSESGLYADAEAALKWLKDHGMTNNRLVIYGFSLGCAPSVNRAVHGSSLTPSKIILEAPFAGAATMVQDAAVLALPTSYFTNLKVDNAQEIKKVTQPLMWMHGTADDFLSITSHGEVVFANHTGTYKEAHRITNATHTNVPAVWGYEAYKAAVNSFIER